MPDAEQRLSALTQGTGVNLGRPGSRGASMARGMNANALASRSPELDYFRALVDPESCKGAKVPDSCNMDTAPYQAILTIPIYGNTAAGTAPADAGRFFVAIQPVLTDQVGASNSVGQKATVVVVNPAATWVLPPTNFDSTNDDNILTLVPNIGVSRGGLAIRCRPVSMSAWLQYTADSITNGGEVSAALATGDTMMNNVLFSGAGNNLTQWEKLADYPHAYQGPLTDGAYVWWRPFGPGDLEFRPTDASAKTRSMYQYDFPTIYFAGQANHPGTTTANQPVARVRICINFEYETDSRVVPAVPSPVSPVAMALAAKLTSGQPAAMANDEHSSWVGSLLKYGAAALAGAVIGGPIGAAASVLGVLGIGKATGG